MVGVKCLNVSIEFLKEGVVCLEASGCWVFSGVLSL